MIITPFELPSRRDELLKKLSANAPSHAQMMAGKMPKQDFDPQQVWKSLRPGDDAPSGDRTPLVIYVHIPFCVARCAFCGFYRNQTNDEAMENYVRHLLTEIDRVADEGVFTRRPVDVVYFGGGTPTALTADQLRSLITRLHERFSISPEVEFTIEGRIYNFDDERVRACVDSGANRFSFGVQSFETDLRRLLGRRNSRDELLARLSRIKDICGDRAALVADLIYGLPGQTQRDWMELNVKTTHLESALDGVDIYSLKIFSGSPIEKMFDTRGGRWSEEERIRRHSEACDYLVAAGWRQLSTTHFGRNSLERNMYNTYAKIGVDMIPFGCGAGGFAGGWSIMQQGDLAKYIEMVDEGKKPVGMMMKSPPQRKTSQRFTRMTDLGYFDPAEIPETDFSPLLDNWTRAGVWYPSPLTSHPSPLTPTYRLTRLGEYYQPKLTSLLTGFHFASHASMADMVKMGVSKLAEKMKG